VQRFAREFPQARLPLPIAAPWFALLELSDHDSAAHATTRLEAVLGAALEAGEVGDTVVAQSLAEARAMWAIREGIPLAHARAGGNIKHDISLPVSAIPEFVAATDTQLAARFPWIQPATFGHLGDGNLHYNMGTKDGVPIAVAFEHESEINAIVNDAVAARGGSISAEHGLGQLKRAEIRRYKSALEIELMQRIKAAFDPLNLMNPGKVL
jgi:FAD/FMN-containing dehydrogenase